MSPFELLNENELINLVTGHASFHKKKHISLSAHKHWQLKLLTYKMVPFCVEILLFNKKLLQQWHIESLRFLEAVNQEQGPKMEDFLNPQGLIVVIHNSPLHTNLGWIANKLMLGCNLELLNFRKS